MYLKQCLFAMLVYYISVAYNCQHKDRLAGDVSRQLSLGAYR